MSRSTKVSRRAKRPQQGILFGLALIGLLMLVSTILVGIAFDHVRGVDPNSLEAQVGGKFTLVDDDGKPFTDAELKGKWHLVFFGYTRCPDICPTALNDPALALSQLGSREKEVGIVFISVDPERDTTAVLKSYVSAFGGPIIGLTGTPQEVAEAAKDYHVYYAKHPTPDGGYDMDHSAVIYIMDLQGRFTATFGPDDTSDMMVTRLRKLRGSDLSMQRWTHIHQPPASRGVRFEACPTVEREFVWRLPAVTTRGELVRWHLAA